MSIVLRLKRLVASYGVLIAVALAIGGLASFGGAYAAYADVPTTQVSEQINEQEVTSQLETTAIVTGNTTLYEQGEVLHDMPVYFTTASPSLTLWLNTTVPSGRSVAVTHEVTLRIQATRDGRPFWESSRTLVREDRRTSGGQVATATTIDIPSIRETVADRRSEVSDVGVLRTDLLIDVRYETGRYSGEFAESTALVMSGRAYWLEPDVVAERTHSETVTRTVRGEPDLAAVLGFGVVGTVSLFAAVGTMLLRRRLDRLAIETQLYRARYEEWISDGEFPTGTAKQYVRINSLEDLVDIAIDSNKRVIYDGSFEVYAAIDSDIIFYFSTDPGGIDSWLDL